MADFSLAELTAVYDEVAREAAKRSTGQVPRQLFERSLASDLVCVAESLGPRTQVLTGIPWILPGGQLSDKGRLLDRELLRPVGHTADPADHSRQYAHLTDVSHLWLGRTAAGKLRRPTTADKLHSASWLEREIQAVRPKVVLLLGRHAAPFFLKRYGGASVSRLDDVLAQPMTCNVSGFRTTALATLHPTGAQMARGGAVRAYRSTVEALIDLVGA